MEVGGAMCCAQIRESSDPFLLELHSENVFYRKHLEIEEISWVSTQIFENLNLSVFSRLYHHLLLRDLLRTGIGIVYPSYQRVLESSNNGSFTIPPMCCGWKVGLMTEIMCCGGPLGGGGPIMW
ncbi:hypothetical protein WR25_00079 [Diploscapter pachys]|uniref:Uncharacterized protein n=1 Tax=Diploscapter pachys TaxID=2018661 RepID=A0A2A2KE63_9BILA|nr:hypothetical protein WR25_00079 [Diploscapter pachys]